MAEVRAFDSLPEELTYKTIIVCYVVSGLSLMLNEGGN